MQVPGAWPSQACGATRSGCTASFVPTIGGLRVRAENAMHHAALRCCRWGLDCRRTPSMLSSPGGRMEHRSCKRLLMLRTCSCILRMPRATGLSPTALWRVAPVSNALFLSRTQSPVVTIPGFSLHAVLDDWMHDAHLGVFQHVAANVLVGSSACCDARRVLHSGCILFCTARTHFLQCTFNPKPPSLLCPGRTGRWAAYSCQGDGQPPGRHLGPVRAVVRCTQAHSPGLGAKHIDRLSCVVGEVSRACLPNRGCCCLSPNVGW